jgi:hemerythrin superfamily protein
MPKTFTEAQERSGFSVVIIGSYRTQSNSRFVPYAEVYRSRTSLMETPAEHLQKAAREDEQHIE